MEVNFPRHVNLITYVNRYYLLHVSEGCGCTIIACYEVDGIYKPFETR